MKAIHIVLLLIFMSCARSKPDPADVLIQNVNIIDITNGAVLTGRDVTITGHLITNISPNHGEDINAKTVIDGAGKYLIPGLWDMHSHPLSERDLLLMLAHGVTGTRIMDGDTATLRWKRQVNNCQLQGPVIYTAGETFEGTMPKDVQTFALSLEGWEVTDTRREAIAAVQRHKKMGYDFIKIYNNLQDSVVEEIFAEAKRQNLDVCGHIPASTGLIKCMNLGIKSVEHLRGYIQEVVANDSPVKVGHDFRSRTLAWAYTNAEKEDRIIDLTVTKGIWNCPTFTFELILAPNAEIADYLKTAEAKLLLDADVKEYKVRKTIPWASNFSDEDFESTPQSLHNRFTFVNKLHARGGRLLAGSDTHVYGPSLHRELENLAACGLTPYEVLKTATLNPALYFDIEKFYGTVEEKKVADLVILNDNPLLDIKATRSIYAVVRNGKLILPDELESIIKQSNTNEGRTKYKRRR